MSYKVTCKDGSVFEFRIKPEADHFFDLNDGKSLEASEGAVLLRNWPNEYYLVVLPNGKEYRFEMYHWAHNFAEKYSCNVKTPDGQIINNGDTTCS
jgi:hypothetical protein